MTSPQELRTALQKRLHSAGRVAVLAVGAPMRGDDAAGLLAAEELAKVLKPERATPVEIFIGESAPENLTGAIRKFQPTHVIVLDAADMGRSPGHVGLIETQAPTRDMSASTHRPPMGLLSEYLQRSIGCEVIVIGIQPATRSFGSAPSAEALQAARLVAEAIAFALPD